IEICSQPPATEQAALEQRQEDLRFHDVLARANPNSLLRFVSETINELIRQVVVIQGRPLGTLYQPFGRHNVRAHRALLRAARERNAGKVRTLMKQHIRAASRFSRGLKAEVVSKLILDGDVRTRVPSPGRIRV